jgi:hypothetical protein
MELKIIVDNKLGKQTGKLSRMTYEKIPDNKKPQLFANNYFYLSNLESDIVIIEIDVSIIKDATILYLHQSAKDLYYPNIDVINI